MKAVRYYGRKDIRVETVKEPKDFGPDQLLVKPLWTGICGTDLHEYIAGPIVTVSQAACVHRGDAAADLGPRIFR